MTQSYAKMSSDEQATYQKAKILFTKIANGMQASHQHIESLLEFINGLDKTEKQKFCSEGLSDKGLTAIKKWMAEVAQDHPHGEINRYRINEVLKAIVPATVDATAEVMSARAKVVFNSKQDKDKIEKILEMFDECKRLAPGDSALTARLLTQNYGGRFGRTVHGLDALVSNFQKSSKPDRVLAVLADLKQEDIPVHIADGIAKKIEHQKIHELRDPGVLAIYDQLHHLMPEKKIRDCIINKYCTYILSDSFELPESERNKLNQGRMTKVQSQGLEREILENLSAFLKLGGNNQDLDIATINKIAEAATKAAECSQKFAIPIEVPLVRQRGTAVSQGEEVKSGNSFRQT